MHLSIEVAGNGEDRDDKIVGYKIKVENDDFKGTTVFYGYADVLTEFADNLLRFPFESNKPIKFESDGVMLEISLFTPSGGINFRAVINDWDGNSVEFNDLTVETQGLHEFAELLKNTDFSSKALAKWTFVYAEADNG